MGLLSQTKQLCALYNIVPSPLKDQHFLVGDTIFQKIVELGHLVHKDIVVEIGPGIGILTRELAKKASKVIAIELDSSLQKILEETLPQNVELIFDNALDVLPQRKNFNKIVANIPYQICEPLFHYLCTAKKVELSVLMVPISFAKIAQDNPIFSAFLDVKIITEVPAAAFFSPPKVISAVIVVIPKSNLNELNNSEFIRQKLYLQRDKKLKNGLRDTIIDYYEWMKISKKKNKIAILKMTKKEADKIIDGFELSSILLEKTIAKLPLEEYGLLSELLQKVKL
ncbi:hypothetical protein J4444_04995 [Candidatus Woesearchaeota archaeon]|nr:hypothetical protein [Candidatus Woesearchaeota archaeon]